MDEWEQEGLNLRKKLRERLDQTREVEDQEIYRQIDDLILEETRNRYVSLRRKEALRTELFNSIRKLDILQELIDDDSVTEIMVNGTEGIFLERNGRLLCWEKKITSKEKLEDMVQQIAGRCNRIVNESVPVADARLSDGSRVSLVLPPVALNGPVITIRRFPKNPIHMDRLVELGAVTTEAAAFLRALVRSGYNIFISGGTGSGKTTFLNALSDFIPKEERIITIEDNAELQIQGAENLVRLEARQANTEGKNSVTIRDLIKASLRMRPEGIKIKEGKLKRKKKRITIPHTFLQHILGNLIPLIRGEVVKIIEEADDLLSLFHSVLHVEGILPIHGICTQHSFPE